jgi:hypothetical protein
VYATIGCRPSQEERLFLEENKARGKKVRTKEKSFGVPHVGQKDTIRTNFQDLHSTWKHEFQTHYQQEDYGVRSIRNRVTIHTIAQ